MNQLFYEQITLDLEKKKKNKFVFVYLANESSLTPNQGSNIKQVKLKYNFVLVNKLVSIMLY